MNTVARVCCLACTCWICTSQRCARDGWTDVLTYCIAREVFFQQEPCMFIGQGVTAFSSSGRDESAHSGVFCSYIARLE